MAGTEAMTPRHDEGTAGRLVWFVMATAVTAIFTLVMGFASNQNARIERMEDRQQLIERSMARFEAKLDLLIERESERARQGARK